MEQVGLSSRAKEVVSIYSGGMKRRLNFACAILHEPKALLLDEPTVGVDPQSREHLLAAVEALKAQGTAVLYTTHYMEEAERLCDRLAIIDHGKVIAIGTVDELRNQMGEKDLITLQGDFVGVDKSVIADYELIEWQDHTVRFMADNAAAHLSEILSRFNQGRIKQTAVQQANLESLFEGLSDEQIGYAIQRSWHKSQTLAARKMGLIGLDSSAINYCVFDEFNIRFRWWSIDREIIDY